MRGVALRGARGDSLSLAAGTVAGGADTSAVPAEEESEGGSSLSERAGAEAANACTEAPASNAKPRADRHASCVNRPSVCFTRQSYQRNLPLGTFRGPGVRPGGTLHQDSVTLASPIKEPSCRWSIVSKRFA